MPEARIIPLTEHPSRNSRRRPPAIPDDGRAPDAPPTGSAAENHPAAASRRARAAERTATSGTKNGDTKDGDTKDGDTKDGGGRNGQHGTGAGADAGAAGARGAGAAGSERVVVTEPPAWERNLAGAMAFLRRRLTGDYEIDDFGFDPDLSDHVLMAAVRPLYKHWFRVETRGLENVPDSGGALVVANHSGTIPIDSMMTGMALLDHHPARRHLRMLGADLVFTMPLLAPMARKAGHTLACNSDAERLLNGGELVGVWPEGFKGIGKPFSERYKLQRFGRGGFVSAALRTGAPIIPCSIVGAEEIYPIIGNLKTLARLAGVPYVPVTPTFPLLGPLGAIPLPSKWIIEFGEPIDTAQYGPAAADDPMLVFNLTDQVRETIQQTLYKLLMQRRSVFF